MPATPQLTLFPESPFPSPREPDVPAPVPSAAESARTSSLTTRPAVLPTGAQWREAELEGRQIGYLLKRSRRSTVGLTVTDSGLRVTAPSWLNHAQVESVMRKKSRWIIDKLIEYRQRREQMALHEMRWQDGETLPYLGVPIRLRLAPQARTLSFSGNPERPVPLDELLLPLPPNADSDRVRDLVQAWLQQRALELFRQRLEIFLRRTGLHMEKLRLACPATRWGSCNSKGTIMLNWRLIHFELHIIDYVAAHEVAHLQEMNHGPRFWALVESLYPDFMQARNFLRRHDPGTLPLL